MIRKERTKSVTLQILESLYVRGSLDQKRTKEYYNQVKGLEGERAFDQMVESVVPNCYLLKNLTLKEHTSLAQIDALIVTGNSFHIFEIKNYTGEYTYKNDVMHSPTGLIIPSPTAQINKSSSLLHNIMLQSRFNFNIHAHVVFINPEFYLYELPFNKPFIFSYQLEKHLQSLNLGKANANMQDRVIRHVLKYNIENYRSSELPTYTYEDLRKGIYCPKCLSFNQTVRRLYKICECGFKEEISEVIERSIKEFCILFPESKITVPKIYDWCGKSYNRKKILYHLKKNYKMHGTNRGIFYT